MSLRKRYLYWGATAAEIERVMPGDATIPEATYDTTNNTSFTPSGLVGNPVGVRSDAAATPGDQQARVWIDGISQTEGWIEVSGYQLSGENTGGVFAVSALKLSLLENSAFGLADLLEESSDGRPTSQVILQTYTQTGATPLRVHAEYEFANVSFSSSVRRADDHGSLYGLSLSFATHEYTHTRYGADGSSTSISTGNLIADGSNDLAPTAAGQQSGLEYYLQLSGSGGDIAFSGLSGTWFRVDSQSLALTGVNGRADFSDLTVQLEFSAGLTNALKLAEANTSLASVRLIGVDFRSSMVLEELKLTGTKISAYDLTGHIDNPGLVGLAFSDYARIEIKRAEIGPNGTVSEFESFGYDTTNNTPFTPSGSLGGSVGQRSQVLPRTGDQQVRVWIDGCQSDRRLDRGRQLSAERRSGGRGLWPCRSEAHPAGERRIRARRSPGKILRRTFGRPAHPANLFASGRGSANPCRT